ncbi:MAG TPA: fused MFS/spermidine synthase [Micromonospora sp.]
MARRRGGGREPVPVDSGLAELRPDPYRPRGYTLFLDGAPQSHVDLDDPTHLEFEYVRRIAAAIDLIAPPGQPLRVLHLGGGALTLPRYVAARRPGSRQRVVEIDGRLVELIRRELPWPANAGLRVRVGDARAVLDEAREASYDLIISDVFAGARTPARFTSLEFAQSAARALCPTGFLIVNLADGPPLRHTRTHVATLRAALPQVCLIADSAVLRRRRYGNIVLVASRVAPPVAELSRRVAADWFPGRVLYDVELDQFVGRAPIVTDATAQPTAPPPPGFFEFLT